MTHDPETSDLVEGDKAVDPVDHSTAATPESRRPPNDCSDTSVYRPVNHLGATATMPAPLVDSVGEMAELRRKTSELESSYRQALGERDLAKELAGRPLVPGASSQLIKLWSENLVVSEEGGVYQVSSRDGRTVSEAVADWLSQPEYAHFCRPESKGGTSPPGVNRSALEAPTSSRPLNLGEEVLLRWRDSMASRTATSFLPAGISRIKTK